MELKELMPVAISLGAAFTLMLVLRAVFKTAITVLRLLFFLVVAAAVYVFLFAPDSDPALLLKSVFHVIAGH